MSDNPISGVGPKVPVKPTKPGDESTGGRAAEKPKNELDTQQFLHLLVKQLENQDPLSPMNSEEFAVQLAQFSQLDELINIRKAVEGTGTDGAPGAGGAVGSMASYLGHEVVLGGEQAAVVENGRASNVLVNVPAGTNSLRIDLTDENGAVSRHTLEDVEPGKQVLSLEQFDIPDGSYDVRVVSVDSDGRFVDLESKVTGTVDGFVLEPEPRLLVNGQEVDLDEVVEVHKAS